MKTLPAEFRYRVIAFTDDGMTTGEIAEILGTSATWVRSINALHNAGKPLEPKSRANKRTSLAEREGDRIRAQVAAKPGYILEDLKRDLGLDTTIPKLWLAARQLQISLKKTPTPPTATAPTSPPTARSGRSSPTASTHAASSSSTKPSAPRT